MNAAMEVLEFVFGLFELSELIEPLGKLVVWLVRAPFRLVRWIVMPSGQRQGRPLLPETSAMRSAADGRTIIHTSLTKCSRGKRRRMSYEAG
jgi:hypothetical protein